VSWEPADLERKVDAGLKRLPAPRAPRTLLPRVMAVVAARRQAPWYARPWLTWPIPLQALSLIVIAAAGAAVWTFWADARVASAVVQLKQASAVVRVLWDVLIGPIAMFVLALTVIVSLACAAAWTAVRHVALGGATPR